MTREDRDFGSTGITLPLLDPFTFLKDLWCGGGAAGGVLGVQLVNWSVSGALRYLSAPLSCPLACFSLSLSLGLGTSQSALEGKMNFLLPDYAIRLGSKSQR